MSRFTAATGVFDIDDVGTGPLVVFGHGLSCDRHLFDAQVDGLRERYRCVALDWPGHGVRTTFDPNGWTLDDLADDVVALLRDFDAGPATLVGLSQGAMVFLRVALQHPQLVHALVLLDTTARSEPPERASAAKANLARLRNASDADREAFTRDLAIPAFFAEPWRRAHPDLVEREVRLRTSHDRLGYELAANAVLER